MRGNRSALPLAFRLGRMAAFELLEAVVTVSRSYRCICCPFW